MGAAFFEDGMEIGDRGAEHGEEVGDSHARAP